MVFGSTLSAAARFLPIAILSFLAAIATAHAAEIEIVSSNGLTAVLSELGPQFERASGDKLVIHYGVASGLKKEIEAGRAFDIAFLTVPATDDLIKQGKIVAGSDRVIAKTGIGVAVRLGSPKPDIGTVAAFKQALLAAKSVAYSTQGASGQYFAGLLERLGIAESVKAKAKLLPGGRVAELVARGEAELAVQQMAELVPVAGVVVVGPLPPEIQTFTAMIAGLSVAAKQSEGAKALVLFLTTPAAAAVIRSKGMEPG